MTTINTKQELISSVEVEAFPFIVKVDGVNLIAVRRGFTDPRIPVSLFYTSDDRAFAFNTEECSEPEHDAVHELTRLDKDVTDINVSDTEEYVDNAHSADGKQIMAVIFGGRYWRPLF